MLKRFDALCDNGQLHSLTNGYNIFGNFFVTYVGQHILSECSINFYFRTWYLTYTF
ncbi:Unknown protein sequence [Pseudomonas syringae pv. maculicola]|nr:Unknown protein sequence [Pseudomonas savastanoi pv. phaseolicola]KPB41648.1 Unknown protein sequence [Pseudomonas savastanoi pv. phaseolicola]KPB67552.1 Unknown protein sequence [Pseudomonas savastanoi pv. phaseolicola]KPB71855.1 Unknown protein sequence [Pseudomonas amygdali pv. mellea]KPB85486.1 Unknown protein sequence [Pseudomonas syringae pv. maculicola]